MAEGVVGCVRAEEEMLEKLHGPGSLANFIGRNSIGLLGQGRSLFLLPAQDPSGQKDRPPRPTSEILGLGPGI